MRRIAPGLSGSQRRMVLGVAIILACASGASASYNFLVDPMALDLGATREQMVLLRQLPNVGTLLVVFLAGVWGSRLGMKRVTYASAVVMTLGYLIVLLAPSVPVATAGLLLGSVGKQGISVVTISLIAARISGEANRATGFAAIGVAGPVAFLVIPVLSSLLLDASNWRVVVASWVLMGAAAVFISVTLLPSDGPRSATGEMWTPALAGLVLAGLVQTIRTMSSFGFTSPRTLGWLGATVIALVILWQLMARWPKATLDLSILKRGGALLLLFIVILVPFGNLFYYFAIGAQRLYGYSAAEAALLMVPCQIAAIAGAWFAGLLLRRLGMRMAGTLLMAGVSVTMFMTVAQQADTPVAYPMLVLSLFALAYTGAGVVLTNAVMNLAPPGSEGSTSSARGAAWQLGIALGVALSAAVFFGTAQSTMQDLVAESGGDPGTAAVVVSALRDSTVTDSEIATQYDLPVDVVAEYDREWLQAQLTGYHAQGLLGGSVALVATVLFFFNRRAFRPQQDQESSIPDPDQLGRREA